MKQVIKVKVLTEGCLPHISIDGDWIDLRAAVNVTLDAPYAKSRNKGQTDKNRVLVLPTACIPLGVAMELPAGMEAVAVSRSSAPKNFNIIQRNCFGVIDNSYCGNNDEWHMPIIATGPVDIKKGDRICQFRIQLSQKATCWQKLKWLFSSGVKIVVVEDLKSPDRGGLGHSGIK